MCAVHCLNALLQYPYFDSVILSEIALNLDAEEQNIVKAQSRRSENVDPSGNFSSQVMSVALNTHSLSMDYLGPNKDPTQEIGFICNLQSHWFTLRKIAGEWYNLNSMLARPEWVSELFLSMLILQIRNEGYTIFVVAGTLPSLPITERLQQNQMLIPVSYIKESRSRNAHRKNEEDEEYKGAIERSMKEQHDEELQRAIEMSMGREEGQFEDDDEEEQLKIAIALSNAEENRLDPVIVKNFEGEGAFSVKVKCFDGVVITKKFLPDCQIQDVADWAKSVINQNVRLIQTFPRRVYENMTQTLNEIGINTENNLLYAEKR